MSELNNFVVDSDLAVGVSPLANANFSFVVLGQSQAGLSISALSVIAGGSGSASSSSSSSSSFVNEEGAGSSSSAISTSPSGTVSSDETVFTLGATASSASVTAIASSTEPGSAIATVSTSNTGNVFAIVPATFDQLFLIVNIVPDIPSGLVDIQSISPAFLTVNLFPDLASGLTTVQFSDRVNVVFEISSAVVRSPSSDALAPQNSISVPVQGLNASSSLIQLEYTQPAFTIYQVVGLPNPIVFDPTSLNFSLELELRVVPVTTN